MVLPGVEPIELTEDLMERCFRDKRWCSFRFSLDRGRTPEEASSVKKTPLLGESHSSPSCSPALALVEWRRSLLTVFEMVFLMDVVSVVGFRLTGLSSVCSLSNRSSKVLLGKARLAALLLVWANSSKDAEVVDALRSSLLSMMVRKLLLRKL